MFIGRSYELGLLKDALHNRTKAQLIIVYGRRRIGKSTLIKKAVEDEKNALFFEGIEGENTHKQIQQFLGDLSRQTGRVKLGAKTWPEVFQGLGELIQDKRYVLVFDEFPWMGAGRTSIVSHLKLYWDKWEQNKNLVLFLCGSIASFMIRHVIHSKALHNRKTLELCLEALSPKETGEFIAKRGLREKAQLYMCLGGVPKYLEQINPKFSLDKNLNRLCFSANGFFLEEYETLFKEQFKSIKTYELIVSALSKSPASLSELTRIIGISKGGGFSDQLTNLVRAQFVREYIPLSFSKTKRKRTRLYKLSDPFLIFYFKYIHDNRKLISLNKQNENLFKAITESSINQYYGFAFERLGEDAIMDIIKALHLKLADIVSMGPYFQQPRGDVLGVQIDWLIIRRDHVLTIIEFKYHKNPPGTEIMKQVKQKLDRLPIPKEFTIEPVLVTSVEPKKVVSESGFFTHVLTLKDFL